jgi:hypothetical protein
LFYEPPSGNQEQGIVSVSKHAGMREANRDGWRKLTVEVTAEKITATVDSQSAWSFTHDKLAERALPHAILRRQFKNLPAPDDCRGDGWGGLGLFVYKGVARIRNVSLEPIPAS